ncbi:MAG: tetratricopeptide repeat protein [Luteitalea sp.]|nr:tetratricopeptide repeat protein [Luteitalea sp.]
MEQSPAPLREVTLEEAVSLAIQLQKNNQLSEAADVYRRILELAPDHPGALHYSGVLAHRQGRSDDGIALIERSLALEPNRADWYSNLGIILRARGKVDDAILAYQHALSLDPNHVNAHSNLGVLLRAQGRLAEAEAAYRTAIRLDPEHIDAYHNLGMLLAGQRRTREAVVCYCKVVTLNPRHASARRLLALAHCTLGQPEKAVEIFERWLEEEPDNAIAQHMLAACSGQAVPTRASDAFVEKTFDTFAASFDSKLAQLSYRAPALVAALLEDAGFEASKHLDVLDAGCGTGLCGPLVAPFARRLVGVDLSSGMLAQARQRNVYDDLVKSELTTYLREHKEAFDVIVSADTLVYFGALEEVVAAAAEALRLGGSLIFTLEEPIDGEVTTDYRLEMHGRYSHAREHVEQLLAHAGLLSKIVPAELRMEAGAAVAGLVIRATKPPGPRAQV